MIDIQTKTPMTVEQAVQFTGYAKSYLYKLIAQGKIPSYKPEAVKQGKVFFCKEEIAEWLFRNRKSTTAELHERADKQLNAGGTA